MLKLVVRPDQTVEIRLPSGEAVLVHVLHTFGRSVMVGVDAANTVRVHRLDTPPRVGVVPVQEPGWQTHEDDGEV